MTGWGSQMTGAPTCPVCDGAADLYDVVDFNKNCEERNGLFLPLSGKPIYYALCSQCDYLFAPEFQTWSDQDFFERIYNDGYAAVDPEHKAIRPDKDFQLVEFMFGDFKGQFSHLDYGGGEGRLSQTLSEAGWRSTSYDPFFNPLSSLAGETFDLITAFEVFEHVPRPHEMMERIAAASHAQTFVFFSTGSHDGRFKPGQRIEDWYVAPRNGHVAVFSHKALAALAGRHGFKFASFNSDQHCFYRTIPPWAIHLTRSAD